MSNHRAAMVLAMSEAIGHDLDAELLRPWTEDDWRAWRAWRNGARLAKRMERGTKKTRNRHRGRR